MSRFREWLTKQIFYAMPTPENPDVLIPNWGDPSNAFHNVRVICDLAGLTLQEKNLICACIYQESQFHIGAINHNSRGGVTVSTDYGLCQVNDYYHIGAHKDFPSIEFVQQNPQAVVEWMVDMYKHGLLRQWVSYSSGAYLNWLTPDSPMWQLKKSL